MHFISQDGFWLCMRRSRRMHLSSAGWRCSLHPCCPSSSWHLSPLGPRCIANEGLVNHTPVCCVMEAGGPAPWLIPSPLSPSFPSVSIPPSFLFCLNKPPPFPYPSDFKPALSFLQSALSFLDAALCFPGVCTSGWGRPERMAEAYLWEELVRRCELNPWLISEHDTVSEPRCCANTSSEDCVCVCVRWREKELRVSGIKNKRVREESERERRQPAEAETDYALSFFYVPFIFCCCFASIQGCAMNWGVANSHQFVKSSLTVVWAVGGGEEGAAADASPPIAEWLLGTGPCWAGPGRQNMPLHFTRHCCIKICAETCTLWQCFAKFRDITGH